MTAQEFVIWLKGFTEGVHDFNVSPAKWDLLKDRLAEVKDEPAFPFGVPNTTPNPHYTDPIDPYRIICGSGTTTTSGTDFTKKLLKDNYNYTLKESNGKSV